MTNTVFHHLHETLKEVIRLEEKHERYKEIMESRGEKVHNQRNEINRLIESNEELKNVIWKISNQFEYDSTIFLSKTDRLVTIRKILDEYYSEVDL